MTHMSRSPQPLAPPNTDKRARSVHVRPVRPGDIAPIHRLYAREVLTGTATFEEIPPTLADLDARHATVLAQGCPYLVAECEGELVGFAYAGPFRRQSAYRSTVENSVYVAPGSVGLGVGRALMERVIAESREAGFNQMIAMIGGENTGSIAFHERLRFSHAGRMERVGLKFARWLDVVIMQRALGGDASGQT